MSLHVDVTRAVNEYCSSKYGKDLSGELELHISQEHWVEFLRVMEGPLVYAGLVEIGPVIKLAGFRVVLDDTLERPELRSTWRYVL